MSSMFRALDIGTLRTPNRFVRSATAMGMANGDGSCTNRLAIQMAELAAGGVGLIIAGHAYVAPEGRAHAGQIGCHTDAMLDGLHMMTEAVHRNGGKISQQISHGGVLAFGAYGDLRPAGPSPFTHANGMTIPEMQRDHIAETVEAFAQAALRAQQAGFDAGQIHAAHGYLLSQFLSPAFNQRNDDYGGSLANRCKLLLEVVAAVRQAVGEDYVVLIKLNSDDLMADGMGPAQAHQVCAKLQGSVDAIELSGGTSLALKNGDLERCPMPCKREGVYWRSAAEGIAATLDIPLILVGGIRSLAMADEIVSSGSADAVSMCRPFIREPGIVARWQGGDQTDSDCISCNGCLTAMVRGNSLHCVRP